MVDSISIKTTGYLGFCNSCRRPVQPTSIEAERPTACPECGGPLQVGETRTVDYEPVQVVHVCLSCGRQRRDVRGCADCGSILPFDDRLLIWTAPLKHGRVEWRSIIADNSRNLRDDVMFEVRDGDQWRAPTLRELPTILADFAARHSRIGWESMASADCWPAREGVR